MLRSADSKNVFAPKEGIRYDGLYIITSRKVLDYQTAVYRYTMDRVSDQHAIRNSGVGARPTKQELAEKAKIAAILS